MMNQKIRTIEFFTHAVEASDSLQLLKDNDNYYYDDKIVKQLKIYRCWSS